MEFEDIYVAKHEMQDAMGPPVAADTREMQDNMEEEGRAFETNKETHGDEEEKSEAEEKQRSPCNRQGFQREFRG
eukprot:3020147-Pyramimonas_sp.AAC.1